MAALVLSAPQRWHGRLKRLYRRDCFPAQRVQANDAGGIGRVITVTVDVSAIQRTERSLESAGFECGSIRRATYQLDELKRLLTFQRHDQFGQRHKVCPARLRGLSIRLVAHGAAS